MVKNMFFKKKKQEVVNKPIEKGSSQYNRLRDNVLFFNEEKNVKVIQISSANANEDKALTASALAVSLGEIGKKVVVVDLDFSNAKISNFLNVENAKGIKEYVLSGAEKKAVVKKTEYENVSVVTVGEIEILNSTSIIVSEKFKALIAELKTEYDYVIINCAPISSSSDYINLSFLIEGAIFLVAHGETKKEKVEIAVKELRKNGVKILGSVFTKYKKKKDLGCNYYTEM